MIRQLTSGPLSLGMGGDAVAQLHRAASALGRTIPGDERSAHIMGAGTVAVIRALQTDLGLPSSGIVDDATVRAINSKLSTWALDKRVVLGTVRDANDKPFTKGFVELYAQISGREQAVGKSPLNDRDGTYQITYQPPTAVTGRVDLRVAVLGESGLLETIPSGANILSDARAREVVDFILSGAKNRALTEFELMQEELAPLLEGRAPGDLTEDATDRGVSLLATRSGYSSDQVAAFVLAHKLKDMNAPPAVVYGLLTQGLPPNTQAMQSMHPELRLGALRAAVAEGTIPETIDGRKTEEYLSGFAPVPTSQLSALLGRSLSHDEIGNFANQYLESPDPSEFWKRIESDPAWASRAADLKLTVQLGALTNNHVPLVAALRAVPGLTEAADLARLTAEDWQALIRTQGVGVPAEMPGADPDDKVTLYANQILAQVEAAFPTRFLAERLGSSPVAAFLKAQPAYDLRTTYPAAFFKDTPASGPTLAPSDRQQLQTLQRLYRLTGSTSETLELSRSGLKSAESIARIDRQVFARQHKDTLSAERAAVIHHRAVRVAALALALAGENGAQLNRTGMRALPRPDLETQAQIAVNSIPDWETLFGAFDLCACQDCASVHGPAAYFVDVLKFLGDRGVRDALFARRPDLGDIELTCENANTAMPLIDLVNEVLEDAVAPPPPFAPQTLDPSLEAELTDGVGSPALAAAFTPPLTHGVRVETLHPGRHWRVWGDSFAYGISKDNSALTVTARSRQTTGTAAERLATHAFRNSAAYSELAGAVYPWTLPFDLHSEEANLFLSHLGVTRSDLIQAMSPLADPPNSSSSLNASIARLGLTETERKIIVDEPLMPPRTPEEFWGQASLSDLTTVQPFLDRSGLTYADLVGMLSTWFVNPDRSVKIAAKPDAPTDTCDTSKLQLTGLSEAVLGRIHRFTRLWRRLGWDMLELDRVLEAFSRDLLSPAIDNEALIRLDHFRSLATRLRLRPSQALALWQPIGTEEPRSLYRDLFYNPSVFKPQHEDFLLDAEGLDLVHTDAALGDHAAALQAVFRLNSEGFALLAANTDGKLSLANLSAIYRHAVLARQVSLSIPDLLIALDLTNLDPFDSEHSEQALQFLDAVKAVGGSGLGWAELDDLLRHRANPAAAFIPQDEDLVRQLDELRTSLLAIEAPSEEERLRRRQGALVESISAFIGLDPVIASVLLEQTVHGVDTAVQVLLALPEITGVLSRAAAGRQVDVLEQVLKTAKLIQTFNSPPGAIQWLFRESPFLISAEHPAPGPIPYEAWSSLFHLQQVRQTAALEDAALTAILQSLDAIAAAADLPAQIASKTVFVETLVTWLSWSKSDIETLIGPSGDIADQGVLGARLPQDFRIGLVGRLVRAMMVLKQLGVPAERALQWCTPSIGEAEAKAIREAAKAGHDEESWQRRAVSIQNTLRDGQRGALVDYLLARPSTWSPGLEKASASELLAHFLIDVEMSSCQVSSRLKQAIGSAQLFAQRALMGLEPGVETADPKWSQWSWMKNFRVWEANRKIWLYPENWIEPALRDDKSPFFKELEDELLQTDVTDFTAEQALLHYLQKLDEVARLEITGVYEDPERKTLHVFGRTFNTPHGHFYRHRDAATLSWSPWQRVDLDIEGNHLIPVVLNAKLMLIWPIFNEKVAEKQVVMPAPGGKLEAGDRYWEIQLAWSDYQNGTWAGKNLSGPVTFTAYLGEDDVLFGPRVAGLQDVVAMARRMDDDGPVIIDDDPPDVDPVTPPPPPRPTSSNGPRRLVPKELISFKGLVTGDMLVVRGYLRRDYRRTPASGDAQIAYPFGEFRFTGCRKIVTTAPNPHIARRNFALAPKGTKFDHMAFTQTAPGLVLYDGTFPVFPSHILPEFQSNSNEPAPAGTDPSGTLVNKRDIPVLNATPWTFRVLAPHQDLWFVGDRPFFFGDTRRTFLATSTGRTSKRNPMAEWAGADLAVAWRGDYFSRQPLPDNDLDRPGSASDTLAPLVALVPGPGGRRVAMRMPAVDLTPAFLAQTLLPTFWTSRTYRFANFHHPYLCDFVKTLASQSLPGLLSLETQTASDPASFDAYQPQGRVLQDHPIDEVEFQSGRAYELYNWELFFHIPMLIADHLGANQRFEDALRWLQFIFDPTAASDGAVPQRYWRTKPFHDRLSGDYAAEAIKSLEHLIASGPSEALASAVAVWRSTPFSPHAVARLRTTAYQKTVVMKYIDTLIAWGDQLFRRDTLEAINEATQLYVLAADILGRRPEIIDRALRPAVETFNSLEPKLGSLGNALEEIELLIADPGEDSAPSSSAPDPDLPSATILYFCVPENQKLVGYWGTVADRLFKIRHCMNIEGQVRQLPLFEPPIDPALLVRAQAAGMSLSDSLGDLAMPLPAYRFSVMFQKASELVGELRHLADGLLSVMEKRDAEALSTLRASQELRVLKAVRDIHVSQIEEAAASIAALEQSRQSALARKDFYESREFTSALEKAALGLTAASQVPLGAKAAAEAMSIVVHLLPDVKAGAPTTVGFEFGGKNKGASGGAFADLKQTLAMLLNIAASATSRMAEYDRRQDEWDLQARLASLDAAQIDRQLTAAQVRLAIAERELRNHDRQIEDAADVSRHFHDKFSSQDLYQWMIGQVSGLYFQIYRLTFDMAKRAERCFQHELGLAYGSTAFIRFGYWDSLKKGLMAGDHLAFDLKRLDGAYLEGNIREYELTKHVSLLALAPEQLIALKETGLCEFEIPEWLFDLDTPGHFRRRIKMVSLTIPSVTGPYTTIHCKATLLNSAYRQSTDVAGGYARLSIDDPAGPDPRFIDDLKIQEAIVTSTGQNDAGLFEPSLRDERYLPFEGAGAISRWRLELPTHYKTFNYHTISDVILHMSYTARDGGQQLVGAAAGAVAQFLGDATAAPLFRLFSLRHEFSSEWHRFATSPSPGTHVLTVDLAGSRFPYFVQGRSITISKAETIASSRSTTPVPIAIAPGESPPDLTQLSWTGSDGSPGLWSIATESDPRTIENIFVVVTYSAA
ncbi:peptidoglycan hydrolase-like protein with peptidoglycan-binding domain [Rhodoligotrophos appendicifer]|uniref:Tc toxin subunit A-related protein n=1 Tax=Rhodoligotrophos appendicifer TaxID=987056 RepID=UPI001186655E|nr:neuraminidase-like domain-containing protein [Rhodoligotrophos appendicifer]